MAAAGVSRVPEDRLVPWFRQRPRWALGVSAALFVIVFAARLLAGDAEDAVSLLYALPVALVAVSFGRTAGIVAGLLGVLLVVVWAVAADADMSLVGWASRMVPLLLLGGLVGDASDRLAGAEARHRQLEAAAQRQRDAVEINDTLIQGMAASKWALEAGRYEAGLRLLEETIQLGERLVSKLLRDSGMGLDGHRPPQRD
jgi:signal transduction histidine kinase